MRGSRIFFLGWGGGGVGGSRPDGQKAVWTTLFVFFCFFCFLVLYLFYSLQRGSNGFITEITILFQGSRGGPTFSRGVQLFRGGGVQMLISIETHITCDFSGGSGPPIPPLDPQMLDLFISDKFMFQYSQSVITLSFP